MTRTETITRELLEAAHDPAALEDVFRRHSHSKGPLYAALAEATTQLCERLG